MTPTKPRPTTDRPGEVHPVVFSHLESAERSAPRRFHGAPVLRFESSSTPVR